MFRCTKRVASFRLVENRSRPASASARAESLRAIIRAIVRDDFGNSQQKAAQALGITRGALNQIHNGHTAAGRPTMDGLVAYLRKPIEEIVAANGDLAALRSPAPPDAARSVEVKFGALPSWGQLLEGARALAPTMPEWCWREVADARVWVRGPVTSAMVAAIADIALRHFPPPGADPRK